MLTSLKLRYLTTAFLTLIITASVIYATPLRYIDLIEPKKINDIEASVFQQKYAENPYNYLFIDVRGKEAYETLHAKGSINRPLHTLYNDRYFLPKEGKEIILICSGGSASGVAYSYLEHYGFTNIKRIDGGIEAWAAQSLPVESSITKN